MATSGTTIIEMNRDSIIKAAMRKIAALAKGQVPDTEDLANGTEALNNLVMEFQTMGMPLWAETFTTIPMTAGVGTYNIGVGQTVNIAFPLKVIEAWTSINTGGSKQILNPMSLYDFNLLPTTSGTVSVPSQYTYHPKINFGTLHIWPAPDTTTVSQRTLTIRYASAFQGFVSASDTPYFPQEWNNALIYGLAALLAPEYGVPLNDRGMLEKEAQKHLDNALDFGYENASIQFQPDRFMYPWG